MSEVLFKRAVRVSLASADPADPGVSITDLRVALKIKKTLKKEPNTCEVSIWNLAATTRAKMQSVGERFIVEAGYQGTIAQIFSGSSSYIDHAHDGPDWVTKVQANDGEIPLAQLVKGSFAKGTSVATVFGALAKQTGFDASDAINFVKNTVTAQFTKGYTAHGKASVELERILAGHGLGFSVQSGKLQVLPTNTTATDNAPVVVLSAQTGLIGSPEHGSPPAKGKPALLKAKSLLQPNLKPGSKVQIKSLAYPAGPLFQVVTVEHSGDTKGGDWYSVVELTPL